MKPASLSTADVVICGAGIAGVSLAHELACRRGVRDVVLVDPEPPLSVTSDKSTECYRNWWPGPGDAMVRLMNRSIDLLEELAGETGDAFSLHPAGYAYCTATADGARALQAEAREVAALGGGELRVHGRGDSGPPRPRRRPRPALPPVRAAPTCCSTATWCGGAFRPSAPRWGRPCWSGAPAG